ncbi:hypothetical protein FJV41_05050 [Myxococcus llanfairpwllgwyngyllgogerychwyrndrobwllllantysiliogogogochensis]|uniref:SCO6045-like C-terminal domain-containing protein n=1 Tax=Myxococcus llanfairpwllgwyngyllgogerychwyrndrobwllllantysiliogogogochensis TaxID=2590453 RepID=A0A540X6Z6_9BACT|nr:hypothetical protein [Myxococcus llanfairpwllgwyngyllgogerychwyrndrobwllllantysiliogogogochensis]TQF17045.1 hypothetical protein FJV41_05050 [Myxococcus llanfairpwllgwyngyllgogerychwyrndrobwllllantysiliogogogochensis]
MTARERLAQAQAELVKALGVGAPVPSGFDTARVLAASESLLHKRRRGVERAWPSLAAALGTDFRARFEPWARAHPMSVEPDSLAEGRRFAASLQEEGRLPPSMSGVLMDFDARWRLTSAGERVRRRGFWLVVRRGVTTRRFRVALRLPGGRVLR